MQAPAENRNMRVRWTALSFCSLNNRPTTFNCSDTEISASSSFFFSFSPFSFPFPASTAAFSSTFTYVTPLTVAESLATSEKATTGICFGSPAPEASACFLPISIISPCFFAKAWNTPPLPYRSSYVPCSTRLPLVRTEIQSACRMVVRRCAIMTVVSFSVATMFSSVAWTAASAILSRAAVASSSSNTEGFLISARAIATLCF
mmetsp:Transcript_16302/g.19547  ORF Transcript_16302/g.19547 Transcript_16302/m.19547 type:complete len:204 (-) Transcript_16302:82-693(-)